MSCHTELCAVVTRTNGTGFQVAGRDGWLNLSKFASVALPAVGQRVRIGLDKSGYVREIAPDTAPATPQSTPAPGSAPDALTARIAALAAATAIVARQPGQTTLDAVLAAAERLEGWIRR